MKVALQTGYFEKNAFDINKISITCWFILRGDMSFPK
jgi:hypothetical protein